MNEECSNCRFWKVSRYRPIDVGECKRYAPMAAMQSAIYDGEEISHSEYMRHRGAYWAVTSLDDWCGDFKAKGQPVSEPPQE